MRLGIIFVSLAFAALRFVTPHAHNNAGLSATVNAAATLQQTTTQNPTAAATKNCDHNEIRLLDFLVGDWVSATTDLKPEAGVHGSGINHIEKVLDGCAILQHRSETRDGKKLFDSYVIWGYDSAQAHLREFVIGDGEHAQVYEGTWENGGWVFYRDRIGDDDRIWVIRVKYAPAGDGFVQTADLTKDRGRTWEKATITEYRRKK